MKAVDEFAQQQIIAAPPMLEVLFTRQDMYLCTYMYQDAPGKGNQFAQFSHVPFLIARVCMLDCTGVHT